MAMTIRNFAAKSICPVCPNPHSNPVSRPRATKVPAGKDWLHEIKHDGYRLIVERKGKTVRLFTRNGHDWTDRYPLIVEAALRNRSTSFVIDGEAVLLGIDGISDFNGLHFASGTRSIPTPSKFIGSRRRRRSRWRVSRATRLADTRTSPPHRRRSRGQQPRSGQY
jgi:ATP-dependent DNA ligase